MRRAGLVAGICLSLSACGFHLRQAPDLPPQLHAIYIASIGHNGDIIRELRRGLESDRTSIVADPTLATATLSIIRVSHDSRPFVLNVRGQPLQFQVAYQVEYTLVAGGVTLIAPETLVLTRNYNYKLSNAIGNEEQEEALFGQLSKDAAQLIIFRVEAVAKTLPPPLSTAVRPAAAASRAAPAAMSSPAASSVAAPAAATHSPRW